MKYPKIYKPSGMSIVMYGFGIIFLLFLAFTQVFPLSTFRIYQPNDGYKFWMGLLLIAVTLLFLYQLIIIIIGYRVTFMPDAIKVTTLLGTKAMQYSDISFYRWDLGLNGAGKWASPPRLYLVSRDPAQNVLDISLLKGPKEKTLKIPLSLSVDQEFKDWIASLPVEIGERPFPFKELGM